MTYTLYPNGLVVRDADGAFIPTDLKNADCQQYRLWVAAGNIPTPAVTPPPGPVIQIISASTPAVNGTYMIDSLSQQKLVSVAEYIGVHNVFPAGQTSLPWHDATGVLRTFPTTALFIAFASAVADYVTALSLGLPTTQPSVIP